MKVYYITRYEHDPNKATEYYVGDDEWEPNFLGIIDARLFVDEEVAKAIAQQVVGSDWHELEIRS